MILNDHRCVRDLGDDRDVECVAQRVDLRKKLTVVGGNVLGMKSVKCITENVGSADITGTTSELISHFVKFVSNNVLHEVFDRDCHYDASSVYL